MNLLHYQVALQANIALLLPPRTPIDPNSGHRLSRMVLAPPPSDDSDDLGEGNRFLRRELNRAYVAFSKSEDELSGVTPTATAAVATGGKFNSINRWGHTELYQ